jgi:hypothetical protein
MNALDPSAGTNAPNDGLFEPPREHRLWQAVELINLKRKHLKRLANKKGAAGEVEALARNSHFVPRPKGPALRVLMSELKKAGIDIKRSSFDAIAVPNGVTLELADPISVRAALPVLVFVEIKTANQARVKPDFSGFFFAFTEGEITASDALGSRHCVMLLNQATGAMLLTSVPEILARAKSTTWQVSVQL